VPACRPRIAGDPALGDEAADIVLRAVGVQRDLGSVKHPQQLILVGVGPGDGLVEFDKAGDPGEDPIEALLQRRPADGCRVVFVEFEISVEPPDQLALQSDQAVLLVGHADDPAGMALGVDPTQGVLENVELSSEMITVAVSRPRATIDPIMAASVTRRR